MANKKENAYRTEHINRFSNYVINPNRMPPTPNPARRCPFKSSPPASRALAPPTSYRGAKLSLRFRPKKIWHSIFFRSKANSKIISRWLLLRRRASPRGSQTNSRFTVPPPYPAWSIFRPGSADRQGTDNHQPEMPIETREHKCARESALA